MPLLLGGTAWPVGWTVGFLEQPYEESVRATLAWHAWIGVLHRQDLLRGRLDAALARLDPLSTPPDKELLVGHGTWTAYFSNDHLGGDPVSWCGHLSGVLGCRAVIASHIPRSQYRYPTTALQIEGPEGPPPLRLVRRLVCGIHDEGRWRFEASGTPQPFEEPARYQARRIMERFDRELLVRYLLALGIAIDADSRYGEALLLTRSWKSARTTPVDRFRRENGRAWDSTGGQGAR